MNHGRFYFFCLFGFWLSLAPAYGAEIKIASWNICNLVSDWSRKERCGGHRTPEDYALLREYAKKLDADVIALQEVESARAAAQVFSPDEYDFFISDRAPSGEYRNAQRTGFAVKKIWRVRENRDARALKGAYPGGRHGKDIEVKVNGVWLRFLSVHLKSYCWGYPLSSGEYACRLLSSQIPPLEDWIDSRTREKRLFAVMGDFNRRFDRDEHYPAAASFWKKIDDGKPANLNLARINRGLVSQCWRGRYPEYIDHIILGGGLADFLKPDSYSQLQFKDAHIYDKRSLSDHCPISAVLDIPER